MKVGYVGINHTVGCTASSTFRLKSYSLERFIAAVNNNLDCLEKTLLFNANNDILFFRITSDLIPFASHEVLTVNWREIFRERFRSLGKLILDNAMRISMHPGQFTVLNSPDSSIVRQSIKELEYHANVLDLLRLDDTAKIQVHVGGIYGDKRAGIKKFASVYRSLPQNITRRLAIENDGRRYSAEDCMKVYAETGIPVIFDVFHHEAFTHSISAKEGFLLCFGTWQKRDGIPMIDYSTQKAGAVPGKHAEHIDFTKFLEFINTIKPYNCDIMIEAKSKEKDALRAVELLRGDPRFAAPAKAENHF